MAKAFSELRLTVQELEIALGEFRKFLHQHDELDERNQILPFFRKYPQIASAIAWAHNVSNPDQIAFEFDLFGDFTVDVIAGSKNEYCLVEFENADESSVFKKSIRYSSQWGIRTMSAFYQLVDWFWKLDDQSSTTEYANRFGSRQVKFKGVIVVGRNKSIDKKDRQRLEWLTEKVIVNSTHIFVYTFDDLLALLEQKLRSSIEFHSSE